MRRALPSTIIALTIAACGMAWGQDRERGSGELPSPSQDAPVFAGQPVAHPFEPLQGQPAATRVLFEGPGPDNTQIVIRELLIGPKGHVHLDALRGPALIEAQSGNGRLRAGERLGELQIATATSVATGMPIELSNDGDDTLVIRLSVVEAR
jgi:hypothetical protein